MSTRSKRLGVTASALVCGLLLCALSGSGLIASVSDTATSVGNNIASGTYTPPTGIGTQIVAHGGCAPSIVFSGAPLTAALSSADIDLNDSGSTSIQPNTFCIKNTGAVVADLSLSFVNVVATEVGACEVSEASAGDRTCEDGQSGELTKVLSAAVLSDVGDCTSPALPFAKYQKPRTITTALAPGAVCGIEMEVLRAPHATSKSLFRAQTDAVSWETAIGLTPSR